MSATQQVTGLASGFDTASIVESLMKIEKIPYEKLDIKKQTQNLKLQAYQAVNSMLMKFRTSVNTLSSQKLWKSKAAIVTNDKILSATANEYAVNGSYSFRVAQLATATQYMSKGFASSKTAFVKQADGETPYQIGTVSLNSAKTRVDTSAKLDVLNGGKGVYRGSIRITDGSNRSSIVDLSACDTLDDIVRTINNADNATIHASVKDGALYIEDTSGGASAMKIQNVGNGTTATDLGIAGSAATPGGAIAGRAIYIMGNDTSLKTLNDGLGVEEGYFHLRVSDQSSYIDILVDVNDCASVGDVIDRVNMEIQARIDTGWVDSSGGGRATELLDGLRFGVSGDKNSFSLTGTKANHSYQFYDDENDRMSNARAASDLGLVSGAVRAAADGEEITFGRVLGDANSPMLKNLSGANGSGVGSAGSSSLVQLPFSGTSLLKHLNSGQGLDISRPLSILLKEAGADGSDSSRLTMRFDDILDMNKLAELTDPANNHTVVDLVSYMNSALAEYAANPDNNAAGLGGMAFLIDEANSRLVIAGAQGGYEVQVTGTMASQLGLLRYDGFGTAIDISAEHYPDYAQRLADRESFYGLSGSDPDNRPLIPGNGTIYTSANNVTGSGSDAVTHPLTTMRELTGFFQSSIDADYPVAGDWDALSDADKTTALQGYMDDMLSKGMTFQFQQNGSAAVNTVTVDFDPADFSVDDTVEDFMNKINGAVQNAFDVATGYIDASGNVIGSAADRMSAPQLRLHTYSDRLQWSNMDWTKSWSITDDAGNGGGILDAAGLARGTYAADGSGLVGLSTQATDAIGHTIVVAGVGYWAPVTGSTALSDLNNGEGLILNGGASDSLDIDLGNGDAISISRQDLYDAFMAKADANAAAAGADTTAAGYDPQDYVSVDEYLSILNDLTQTQLAAVNAGKAEADKISFKFGLAGSDGLIAVTDMKNVDKFATSGALANAFVSGIAEVDLAPDASAASIAVGQFIPKWENQDIEGIGDIKFTFGDEEITLNTAGLSEDSTLAQLLDRLNGQLVALAAQGGAYAGLQNVSFELNSSATGIAVSNNSSKRVEFVDTRDANKLAQDLGLVGDDGKGVRIESYSHYNSTSLGKKYIGRATDLKDFLGSAVPGTIKLTGSNGDSTTLDLATCKTVGDVIDFINDQGGKLGIKAQINARGDGFDIIEDWSRAANPPSTAPTGNISIEDMDGGDTAKLLKISGTGAREDGVVGGRSHFRTSHNVVIDVMSTDTLESLMYRISEKGGYKTAIINDGTSTNPYRLTVASTGTGEASDFVIESDLDIFGFNETSRAKDAKVLYGDPNGGSSPIMLSSATNSNSNAILGVTLDLKQASSEWVTVTVDTDKEKVVEEIKSMVQSYNDLNDLVSYLDAYDEETGEPGILFGDSSIRKLMEEISDMFYLVFNPDQKKLGSVDANGVQNTWSWMDMGVSLSARNTAADNSGAWYSTMELDLDALEAMVSQNWEKLYSMLAGERNASDSTLGESIRASGVFNGKAAEGFKVDNAINGDSNKGSWGVNNGFMADGTIKEGQDTYEIYFQKATTISRMSIYHFDSETALKNFEVEYLDSSTGKWETLRSVENNSSDANHLGFAYPVTASALRIKAASTNAEDGKFRLLDVQVYENIGLAGQLNNLTTQLGDSINGFLAERNNTITETLADIDEQMTRLQERLDLKEQNLWKRFTAMETAMSQLQSQSSYFTSMMDSMSSSKKK